MIVVKIVILIVEVAFGQWPQYRGQSPVEWGEIPSIRPSLRPAVCLSVPPFVRPSPQGQQARPSIATPLRHKRHGPEASRLRGPCSLCYKWIRYSGIQLYLITKGRLGRRGLAPGMRLRTRHLGIRPWPGHRANQPGLREDGETENGDSESLCGTICHRPLGFGRLVYVSRYEALSVYPSVCRSVKRFSNIAVMESSGQYNIRKPLFSHSSIHPFIH